MSENDLIALGLLTGYFVAIAVIVLLISWGK